MESLENKCISEKLRLKLMRCYFNEINQDYSDRSLLDEIKEHFSEVVRLFSQDILPQIKSGCIILKRGYTRMTYLLSKK